MPIKSLSRELNLFSFVFLTFVLLSVILLLTAVPGEAQEPQTEVIPCDQQNDLSGAPLSTECQNCVPEDMMSAGEQKCSDIPCDLTYSGSALGHLWYCVKEESTFITTQPTTTVKTTSPDSAVTTVTTTSNANLTQVTITYGNLTQVTITYGNLTYLTPEITPTAIPASGLLIAVLCGFIALAIAQKRQKQLK